MISLLLGYHVPTPAMFVGFILSLKKGLYQYQIGQGRVHTDFCLRLGLLGIVMVYRDNSWVTISSLRTVGDICKDNRRS